MEMTVISSNSNHVNGPTGRAGNSHETPVDAGYGIAGYGNGSYESMESGDDDVNDSRPQHREMAIDVPDNFVGVKKEPPRYPAQIHGFQSANSSQHNTPSKSSTGSARKSSLNNSKAPSMNTPSVQQPPKMSRDEELQNLAKIQKYQEELRKRKEQEEHFQREQEFLRNSLRESQKLKELQENGAPKQAPANMSGFANPNYFIEEEDVETMSKSSTLPMRQPQPVMHKKPMSSEQIAALLQRIQARLRHAEDIKDVTAVQAFFDDPLFLQTLYVHNKIVEASLTQQLETPEHLNSRGLSVEVLQSLPLNTNVAYVQELVRLLQAPHFQGVLKAHDGVAHCKQQQLPKGPSPRTSSRAGTSSKRGGAAAADSAADRDLLYERASQYGEESIKIVRLQKSADPLGATVRNEGESVVIGRIVKGGAAEKSGLLHEGDEILEINGIDLRGKSVDEVCDLMAALTNTVTFLIVPGPYTANAHVDKTVHYKAHFDYDPEEDPYIPCRELGIMFRKGDILHVMNQSDSCWWQAYREGEEDQNLAGLIPSRSFQEQKETLMMSLAGDAKGKNNKNKCLCQCRPNKNKKTKKQHMYSASGEEGDEEILTYEEVSLYYPQPNRKRPIVMIGPPNVGRQELRQRLMESDLDRFAAAVPHTSRARRDTENNGTDILSMQDTSRARKDTESNGTDYHFVTRQTFEADIANHKFVEYGEFEKNLYGTSLDSIRMVVNTGKICVLNLHPQSLRILKASDLKPYVVFIAPPNIEKLKHLRLQQDRNANVTDSELQSIIDKAREMEENFGHYFDFIIMNYDTNRAYEDLLKEINRLEVEPQWVPALWLA